MSDRDTWRPQWADVAASVALLSRLPVRVDVSWAKARGAHQCWAYGVAGLILGTISERRLGLAWPLSCLYLPLAFS